MGTEIWTFAKYMDWVRGLQPKLDQAWERLRVPRSIDGTEDPLLKYLFIKDALISEPGFVRVLYPYADNIQFYSGASLDESLQCLRELGFLITAQQEGVRGWTLRRS